MTIEEAKKEFGYFPELGNEENGEIWRARASGFASFFPAYPSAAAQAQNTLRTAREWNLREETRQSIRGLK